MWDVCSYLSNVEDAEKKYKQYRISNIEKSQKVAYIKLF